MWLGERQEGKYSYRFPLSVRRPGKQACAKGLNLVRRHTAGYKNALVQWAVGQYLIFVEEWRNMCLITNFKKGSLSGKLTFTAGE